MENKKIIVFNTNDTDFDSLYNNYANEMEEAYCSFSEYFGQYTSDDERRAAYSYLSEVIRIHIKYNNCSEYMDKETTATINKLCEMYGFNKQELGKLYKYHLEHEERAVSVYTILEQPKEFVMEFSKSEGPLNE